MVNKNNKSSNKKKLTKSNEMQNSKKNTFVMKLLVFIGVAVLFFILVYLCYHFFVKNSDIKINMSTDKQMEYITIAGNEELIMTQKYVSDLAYNMRYDINDFKVFKYKKQDIYKNKKDERVLVVVEKSSIPNNCETSTLDTEYNNCYLKIDNYTEEYYISTNNTGYKITVKSPGTSEFTEGTQVRINYMLNTFTMTT